MPSSRGSFWPRDQTCSYCLLPWQAGSLPLVPPGKPICGSWPCCLVTVTSDSSATPWAVATRLLCPWDFPGKNTGVGYHFLLQGIFLTQGSNQSLWRLLHRRADSLLLYHLGSLVVQWLGIRLPMRGTWVPFLLQKDPPICFQATEPVHSNY